VIRGSATSLAVLGGRPAFEEPLHVGAPNLPSRTEVLRRVEQVLDSGRLTNEGPCVREFEQRVGTLAGVEHCVATCNATMGLAIVCRALGLTGEVILPSFTFIATAHALEWLGLTPVFCDIAPETHQLDPRRVAELIGPRTSAILGVHLWGRTSAAPALEELAHRHGLAMVFDAAHAFACAHRSRSVGTFGDAEVFSFHATKLVSTLEGGAVVTRDADLAERVRLMHRFGFTGYDEVSSPGINAKLDEFSAAFGLASLDELDTWIAANRSNHELYRRCLEGVEGLHVMPYDEADRNNYQYVVLEVGPECPLTRDELRDALWAENVLARRYFHPGCHAGEPYRSADPAAGARLPVTESVAARVLCLPTGSAVGAEEIVRIAEISAAALDRSASVRRALAVA